ncbi:MAG: response regulator receiver [Elusimicrobia bacterium]|nr:MAG: response regulator receiver [Elusimicrobiota bacterium]KAF0154552.1 MAG: response regulator receiver [Elusimicrobiota bacterium]
MKPKVLLIDDDFCALQVTARYFRMTGWTVRTARDGKEGLRMAFTDRPDFVIVDYMMPVLNGHDFTVRLHAGPSTREVPVLMLSGRDLTPELSALLERDSAFVGFLAKPARFSEIEEKLRKTLKIAAMTDKETP